MARPTGHSSRNASLILKGDDEMATKAKIKANNKYNQANTVQVIIRLNKKTDADIISMLQSVDNKAGYIKALIRKDI